MKLENVYAVLLVLILLIPTCGMADVNPKPADLWIVQQNDARPVLMQGQQLKLIPKTLRELNSKLNYIIVIRYPQVVGVQLSSAHTHFNQLIQTFIDEQVSEFKKEVTQSSLNQALPAMRSYLNINYEMAGFVSQSQHTDFASIHFTTEGFTRGMAHPYHSTQVFNYNLGSDKALTLADLFKPDSDYLTKIAAYCIHQLQTKKLPDNIILPADMIKEGAAPKPENYQNWNLTLTGLLITFEEAQVAPRYFGAQQVLIPRDFLKNIVTDQTACTIGILNCDKT